MLHAFTDISMRAEEINLVLDAPGMEKATQGRNPNRS